MHCSLTVDQKHVLIAVILRCILSVPLATSTVFDMEHSSDKYLWKVGREGGSRGKRRRRERKENRQKGFPSLGVSAKISCIYSSH